MNYNNYVRPFTEAFAKTKGVKLPNEPVLMDEAARRFLWDNVQSEMGEYYLAKDPWDKTDALVDAIVYTTDVCLRHGIEPELPDDIPLNEVFQELTPMYVANYLRACIVAEDLDDQRRGVTSLLFALVGSCVLPVEPFLEQQRLSNGAKIAKDGTVTLSDKGKILKPEGWKAPDVKTLYLSLLQ